MEPSDHEVQNGLLAGSVLKLLKEVRAVPLDVNICTRTLEGRCQNPHGTVVNAEAGRTILALSDMIAEGVEVKAARVGIVVAQRLGNVLGCQVLVALLSPTEVTLEACRKQWQPHALPDGRFEDTTAHATGGWDGRLHKRTASLHTTEGQKVALFSEVHARPQLGCFDAVQAPAYPAEQTPL